MIHSISQIQEGILNCDGSCRDFTLISPDRIAVSELVAWFYERYSTISACGDDGVEISSESINETIIGLSESSYIHIGGESSNSLINKIQLFLCVAENNEIDVEITFFPQDIDVCKFDITSFLELIQLWQSLAKADEGFLRYENTGWSYSDVGHGSGVIYVSKST